MVVCLEISKSVQTNGTMHKMFYIYEYIVDYIIGTLTVPFVALIHGITIGAVSFLELFST
jgi:enoyl-CoA hydratase/carnithine racemase